MPFPTPPLCHRNLRFKNTKQAMPAYIIGRVEITDPARYAEYMKATPSVIARFGGKFIIRGGDAVTLEGPPETRRIVVIEFPTLDQARAFYDSDEYLQAKKLRDGAAVAQFIAMDGCTKPSGNKVRWLLFGLIGILTLGLGVLAFQPTPTMGKFPDRFSAGEQREIESLVRNDAYRRTVRAAIIGAGISVHRRASLNSQSIGRIGCSARRERWRF